jgi:hypothetical protein
MISLRALGANPFTGWHPLNAAKAWETRLATFKAERVFAFQDWHE